MLTCCMPNARKGHTVPLTNSFTISADESGARELVSFILFLFEAQKPVLLSTLKDVFCAEKSPDAARKTLSRLCKRASALGVSIKKTGNSTQTALVIDTASLYSLDDLPPEELLLGTIRTCEALLDTNALPYQNDLRIALAKLDPNFAGTEINEGPKSPCPSEKSRIFEVFLDALEKHYAINAWYTDPAFSTTNRLLAPLGYFFANDSKYIAAMTLDEAGGTISQPKTFRVDRFDRAQARKDVSFTVPDTFDIRDFYLLPFEFGPDKPFTITVKLLDNFPPALRQRFMRRASEGRETNTWTISVRDQLKAISWCIANNVLPKAPQDFVALWKESLARGVSLYGNEQ